MDNQKIRKITINNLKRIKHLELKGFSNFNIITGQNNIGKTTILQALYLQKEGGKELSYMSNVFDVKHEYLFHKNANKLNVSSTRFDDTEHIFQLYKKQAHSSKCNNNASKVLCNNFEAQDYILDALKIFDNTIVAINVVYPDTIYVIFDDGRKVDIKQLGRSSNGITTMVLTLIANSNNIMLIDDIEGGLHHTKYKQVISLLFKLCQKYNVQLFATTHSKEFIEAFIHCAKDYEYCRIFTIQKHLRNDRIVLSVRDVERMIYAYDYHIELRGE